jgi:hypothetical protein
MFPPAAPAKTPVAAQQTAPTQQKPMVAPIEQKAASAQTVNNQQHPIAAPSSEYWVQSVVPSGKESQRLELVGGGGEVVSAYVRNSDKGIVAGSKLKNVAMEQKQSSYGQYNLISGYQIASAA